MTHLYYCVANEGVLKLTIKEPQSLIAVLNINPRLIATEGNLCIGSCL